MPGLPGSAPQWRLSPSARQPSFAQADAGSKAKPSNEPSGRPRSGAKISYSQVRYRRRARGRNRLADRHGQAERPRAKSYRAMSSNTSHPSSPTRCRAVALGLHRIYRRHQASPPSRLIRARQIQYPRVRPDAYNQLAVPMLDHRLAAGIVVPHARRESIERRSRNQPWRTLASGR